MDQILAVGTRTRVPDLEGNERMIFHNYCTQSTFRIGYKLVKDSNNEQQQFY